MSTPVATPTDLGVYLGTTVDTDRAALILDLAQGLCESITPSPLPDAARAVVLAVAARAFNNITSAHQMGLGSAQVSYGAQGSGVGVGGLYLSRTDVATLRRLAGGSSAFTIDPTPADAGQGLQPWDQNVTWLNGVPVIEEQR